MVGLEMSLSERALVTPQEDSASRPISASPTLITEGSEKPRFF